MLAVKLGDFMIQAALVILLNGSVVVGWSAGRLDVPPGRSSLKGCAQ
jgi:hypothetical protein